MDPKNNNNNHIVEDLKNSEEQQIINDAISKYRVPKETTKKEFNGSFPKDKMMKLLLIMAVFIVLIVIVLIVFSNIMYGKKTYSDVENIMIKSAKDFYSDNSNLLPQTTGGTVEVSVQNLINGKYMKPLSKYGKSSCNGKVVVENNDDDYLYVAYLDCGSSYKTTEFYRELTKEGNVVATGDGLYRVGNEYIYRGENVNNYVTLNDNLYRVVKINSDNEVALIKEDKISQASYVWDDRYNVDKKNTVGINDFNKSRIKDTLIDLYDNEETALFSKNIQNHIVSHDFCVGKRSENETSKDNSVECSVVEKLKVGTLTVSEYMFASLDDRCTSTLSRNCQNYNYLANEYINWWLLTANSANSFQAYYVVAGGEVLQSTTTYTKKIRPVIYLNSKTMYKSGNGTVDKPYVLK